MKYQLIFLITSSCTYQSTRTRTEIKCAKNNEWSEGREEKISAEKKKVVSIIQDDFVKKVLGGLRDNQ